ncbi:MAG: TadE/TadG family type IV pilus assembly protein [Candidatus Binataceae bacterium]
MAGQDMVEFALVIPIFLVLIFMVTDFGRMFFVQMNLQQAVQKAARYGSTGAHATQGGSTDTRIQSIIYMAQQYAYGAEAFGASVSNIEVTSLAGGSGSAGGPQDTETVSITENLPLWTPMISRFFPDGQYTFTASCTIKNEPFPPDQTK